MHIPVLVNACTELSLGFFVLLYNVIRENQSKVLRSTAFLACSFVIVLHSCKENKIIEDRDPHGPISN